MKCILNSQQNVARRTTDKAAAILVASGDWTFCPKHLWKAGNPIPRKAAVVVPPQALGWETVGV